MPPLSASVSWMRILKSGFFFYLRHHPETAPAVCQKRGSTGTRVAAGTETTWNHAAGKPSICRTRCLMQPASLYPRLLSVLGRPADVCRSLCERNAPAALPGQCKWPRPHVLQKPLTFGRCQTSTQLSCCRSGTSLLEPSSERCSRRR